jgi:hypothetical protein
MDLLVGIRVNSGLIMAFVGAAVFTVRIQKMVILVVGGQKWPRRRLQDHALLVRPVAMAVNFLSDRESSFSSGQGNSVLLAVGMRLH